MLKGLKFETNNSRLPVDSRGVYGNVFEDLNLTYIEILNHFIKSTFYQRIDEFLRNLSKY